MHAASAEPAFGSPEEIDTRLAAAEANGLIKLTPISANLGVRVEGVDLKSALSQEQVGVVYDALIRHKVLVFKKIGINHEQQVRFTYELSGASENIGAPTIGHTVFGHVDQYPEIFSVYQGPKSKPRNMERYEATAATHPWTGYHCDITACVNPPSIGMLRGEIIPEGVGDTNFGSLAAAYETLDEPTRAQVETLVGRARVQVRKIQGQRGR